MVHSGLSYIRFRFMRMFSYVIRSDNFNNANLQSTMSVDECGVSKYADAGNASTKRIAGGVEARPHEFPWMVGCKICSLLT